MEEELTKKEEQVQDAPAVTEPKDTGTANEVQDAPKGGKQQPSDKAKKGRGRKKSFSRQRRGQKQQKSEFDSRIISVRRVSRVVAGGRRFSISAAVAVGDGKGRVGVGTSKGQDMASATEKARRQAQKNVVRIPLTSEKGVPSDSIGKHCASVVQIRPAKGFVAGGAVRTIAELAGIQYISAKIQSRSKSHLNNARATIKALRAMKV